MGVVVDIDDSRPIWLQLTDEVRRRIAAGEWTPGQRIPSVRELALDLGVNPNTIQRSLTETDHLGLTVPERTAGRFVTKDRDLVDVTRAALATDTTDVYIRSLVGIGMDLDEAQRLLASRWCAAAGTETAESDTEPTDVVPPIAAHSEERPPR